MPRRGRLGGQKAAPHLVTIHLSRHPKGAAASCPFLAQGECKEIPVLIRPRKASGIAEKPQWRPWCPTISENAQCPMLKVAWRGKRGGAQPFFRFSLVYSQATVAPLMLCHTLKMAPGMVAMG